MSDDTLPEEPAVDPVLLDVTPEGVAMITLNRPERHNALNEELVQKLTEILEDLEDQDGIRAVLIDGAGDSFSSGDDVEEYARKLEDSESEYRDEAGNIALMLMRLRALQVPTIALVHGVALSSGLGIVAACDMAIATSDAQFGLPEVRLGLIPSAAAPYLAEAIGIRATRRYALTGERFSVHDAVRLGLVTSVVADQAGLASESERLITALLDGAPGALAATKELLDLITYMPADEDLVDETVSMFAERRHGPEGRAGIAAIADKRKPDWDAEEV